MPGVLAALQVNDAPIDPGLGSARAIVGLVVVFVLLAGFLWLLRRGTFSLAKRGPKQELALETAISLGERRSLIIVAVEGRRLLLGASPGQVSLITELQPSAAPSFGASLDVAARPAEQGSRR